MTLENYEIVLEALSKMDLDDDDKEDYLDELLDSLVQSHRFDVKYLEFVNFLECS